MIFKVHQNSFYIRDLRVQGQLGQGKGVVGTGAGGGGVSRTAGLTSKLFGHGYIK